MALTKHKITPCLWFDTGAEEAAKFYVSVFKNSKLGKISRYGKGEEIHGKKPGSVMVAEFEIDGQPFVALNGGPQLSSSSARPCHSKFIATPRNRSTTSGTL
jgi:predicted 3-demethylubiquinone-9 3-methyltransferase (glyoxalase superfamily)